MRTDKADAKSEGLWAAHWEAVTGQVRVIPLKGLEEMSPWGVQRTSHT